MAPKKVINYAGATQREISRETLLLSVLVGIISGIATDFIVEPYIEAGLIKAGGISK